MDLTKRKLLASSAALPGLALSGVIGGTTSTHAMSCPNDPGNILNYTTGTTSPIDITTAIVQAQLHNQRVLFPPGEYELDNPSEVVLAEDNREFVLSRGARIRLTNATKTGIVLKGKRVAWYGGEIYADATSPAFDANARRKAFLLVDGDGLLEPQNVTVDSLMVTNAAVCGITVYRSVGVDITGCNIEAPDLPGTPPPTQAGIHLTGSAYVRLLQNTVRRFRNSMFFLGDSQVFSAFDGGADSSYQRSLCVHANRLVATFGTGIRLSGPHSDALLTDNVIVSPNGNYPILARPDGNSLDSVNLQVTGNRTKLPGGCYFENVSGCTFRGNNSEIVGNSSGFHGVRLEGSLRECLVSDNVIKATNASGTASSGVYLNVPAGDALEQITLTGNIIQGGFATDSANAGIRLEGAQATRTDLVTITDNMIEFSGPGGGGGGLLVNGASGTLLAAGNSINGYAGAGVVVTGTLEGLVTTNILVNASGSPLGTTCSTITVPSGVSALDNRCS